MEAKVSVIGDTVDQNMKLAVVVKTTRESSAELWGQVILNDSTCKSNVFGMPLNLTMAVDGYVHAPSVAFALLTNEASFGELTLSMYV